tara:strand:- start:491 stop:5509 length:5019 start_codon:yes stop_codon:yes gene_type:complete
MAKFKTAAKLLPYDVPQSVGPYETGADNTSRDPEASIWEVFEPKQGRNLLISNSIQNDGKLEILENLDKRISLGTYPAANRDFWENNNFNELTFSPYLTDINETVDTVLKATPLNQTDVIQPSASSEAQVNNADESVWKNPPATGLEPRHVNSFAIDALPFVVNPNTKDIIHLDRYWDKNINPVEYDIATEGKINFYLTARTAWGTGVDSDWDANVSGTLDVYRARSIKSSPSQVSGKRSVRVRYIDDASGYQSGSGGWDRNLYIDQVKIYFDNSYFDQDSLTIDTYNEDYGGVMADRKYAIDSGTGSADRQVDTRKYYGQNFVNTARSYGLLKSGSFTSSPYANDLPGDFPTNHRRDFVDIYYEPSSNSAIEYDFPSGEGHVDGFSPSWRPIGRRGRFISSDGRMGWPGSMYFDFPNRFLYRSNPPRIAFRMKGSMGDPEEVEYAKYKIETKDWDGTWVEIVRGETTGTWEWYDFEIPHIRSAFDLNASRGENYGFHLFKLNWGDGSPIEFTGANELKRLESTTLLEHYYDNPGFYNITGVVGRMDDGVIINYEKFQTNILLNSSPGHDLELYDYDNFASIGGLSKNSSLVKSLYSIIGINPLNPDVDSENASQAAIEKLNQLDKIQILNTLGKIDYNNINDDLRSLISPYQAPMDGTDTSILGCTDSIATNYEGVTPNTYEWCTGAETVTGTVDDPQPTTEALCLDPAGNGTGTAGTWHVGQSGNATVDDGSCVYHGSITIGVMTSIQGTSAFGFPYPIDFTIADGDAGVITESIEVDGTYEYTFDARNNQIITMMTPTGGMTGYCEGAISSLAGTCTGGELSSFMYHDLESCEDAGFVWELSGTPDDPQPTTEAECLAPVYDTNASYTGYCFGADSNSDWAPDYPQPTTEADCLDPAGDGTGTAGTWVEAESIAGTWVEDAGLGHYDWSWINWVDADGNSFGTTGNVQSNGIDFNIISPGTTVDYDIYMQFQYIDETPPPNIHNFWVWSSDENTVPGSEQGVSLSSYDWQTDEYYTTEPPPYGSIACWFVYPSVGPGLTETETITINIYRHYTEADIEYSSLVYTNNEWSPATAGGSSLIEVLDDGLLYREYWYTAETVDTNGLLSTNPVSAQTMDGTGIIIPIFNMTLNPDSLLDLGMTQLDRNRIELTWEQIDLSWPGIDGDFGWFKIEVINESGREYIYEYSGTFNDDGVIPNSFIFNRGPETISDDVGGNAVRPNGIVDQGSLFIYANGGHIVGGDWYDGSLDNLNPDDPIRWYFRIQVVDGDSSGNHHSSIASYYSLIPNRVDIDPWNVVKVHLFTSAHGDIEVNGNLDSDDHVFMLTPFLSHNVSAMSRHWDYRFDSYENIYVNQALDYVNYDSEVPQEQTFSLGEPTTDMEGQLVTNFVEIEAIDFIEVTNTLPIQASFDTPYVENEPNEVVTINFSWNWHGWFEQFTQNLDPSDVITVKAVAYHDWPYTGGWPAHQTSTIIGDPVLLSNHLIGTASMPIDWVTAGVMLELSSLFPPYSSSDITSVRLVLYKNDQVFDFMGGDMDNWEAAWGSSTVNFARATDGCTVPPAFNYNPNATIDDGSCQYNFTIQVNQGGPHGYNEQINHSVTELGANFSYTAPYFVEHEYGGHGEDVGLTFDHFILPPEFIEGHDYGISNRTITLLSVESDLNIGVDYIESGPPT